MNAFRLAVLDLTRRPLSSAIAILSISLSVATAGTLLRVGNLAGKRYSSLARGTEAIVGAKSGDLDILLGALNSEFQPSEPPGYLPIKLFESLKAGLPVKFEDGHEAQPGFIKSITPFVYAGTLEGVPAVGTDETLPSRFPSKAGEAGPLPLQDGAWPAAPGDLAVGSVLARERGYHVGQVVSVDPLLAARPGTGPDPSAEALGKPMPFKIVGLVAVTHSAWDQLVWMSLPSARVMLTHTRLRNSIWGVDVLNYFLIDLNPGGLVKLEALVNDRSVGQVVSVPAAQAKLQKLTSSGRDVGLLVVGLVLAMAVLSLASVLITRFESLSLQLAVLRAIGYAKSELAAWLLIEGLLLGAVACFIGAICDAVALPIVRSLLGGSLPSADLVSSSVFESFPIWIAALVATVFSVAIPIIRAYRQDIHTSLRA